MFEWVTYYYLKPKALKHLTTDSLIYTIIVHMQDLFIFWESYKLTVYSEMTHSEQP